MNKQGLEMNLQLFATPEFNPDTTTMMSAKTGSIPRNVQEEIITGVKTGSALLQLGKAVPMTKPIEEFTYMTGVGAYWVSEAERIQTSKPTFAKAEMRAHKLGVIIPTTKENLRYSVTNFFGLMMPEIAEAFYKKIDQAGFNGIDSPWAFNITSTATDAGNVITNTGDVYADINSAIGAIEDEDLDPNGIATSRGRRQDYRASLDGVNRPIFNETTSNGVNNILGLPVAYTSKGTLGDVKEVVADWDAVRYGILQGIEYEILDQATLTTVVDEEGNPLNLAERDMVALKATMMVGFMITNDESVAIVTGANPPKA